MPFLYVTRHRVSPPSPYVGHVFEIPDLPNVERCEEWGVSPADLLASWQGDRAAFWAAIGMDDKLLGVGKPDELVAVGLHEPTPWEQAVLQHLSWRLGRKPTATADSPRGPFAGLATDLPDPLMNWPDAPPRGLATVAGDDVGLEAVGVATELRAELVALPPVAWSAWVDDTLVLVPDSPGRLATWRRVFEARGLPVQVQQSTLLADTSFGRWLIAVAKMAAWADAPLDREVLRQVLLAPWCRLQQTSRSDLRRLLRSLRRPHVTRSTWTAHVRGYFQQRREGWSSDVELEPTELAERHARAAKHEEGTLALTARLADVWAQQDPWRALRRLVGATDPGAMHVQKRASGAGASAIQEVASCIRQLDTLVGQPVSDAPAAVLKDRLGKTGLGSGAMSDHGVRLQTWSTWDGRGAARVVLAGLEEGGWPRAPQPLSPADRDLQASLGGVGPIEELSRQARVAARALASATERAWLSWSRTDDRGSRTFPGALIAGLPSVGKEPKEGDPGRPAWLAWQSVATRTTAADVLPDARTPPVDPLAVYTLAPAVSDVSGEPAAVLDRNRAAVDADGRVHAGRTAASPTPWSGVLAEPLLGPDDRVSPTALEVLGACPIRYLFAKELRAKEEEDAGAVLDPLETGSLIHEALARVAQQAGTWRPGDPGSADEVAAAVRSGVQAQGRAAPSMSGGLLSATASRWTETLARHLEEEANQGEGGIVASAEAASLDAVDDETLEALAAAVESDNASAAKDLRRWIGVPGQIQVALTFLDEADFAGFSSQAKVKAAWDAARGEVGSLLSYTKLDALRKEGGSADARARMKQEVEEKTSNWRAKAEKRLADLVELDRMAVPRRVVGAEWSFGSSHRDGADPASTETPLVVPLSDGRTLALKGQVDRIDAAQDRGDLAVVDYKSGQGKSSGKLAQGFGRGTDLQLGVYAEAVEALHPAAEGGTVVAGRLAFVRARKEAGLWLEAGGASWVSPEDGLAQQGDPASRVPEPVTSRRVLLEHLDHAEQRLSSGILPLKPRHCPLMGDSDAWCDYEHVCGLVPEASEALEDPHPQPRFEALDDGPSSSRSNRKAEQHTAGWEALATPAEPPKAQIAEPAHQAAVEAARDVTRDVFLSAGAGSGKTRALVARYVAALHAGAQPDQILAITFTRKATAEMRARVRSALRKHSPEGPESTDALRGWLQALGAAPICTLDALSAAVVRELGGDDADPAATDAARWSRRWLEGRLVEASDAPSPPPELATLLAAWPVKRVQEVLQSMVLANGAGRALPALAELKPATLVRRWADDLLEAEPELSELRAVFTQLKDEVDDALAGGASGNDDKVLRGLREALEAALMDDRVVGTIGLLWGLRNHSVSTASKGLSDEIAEMRAIWDNAKARWMPSKGGPLSAMYEPLNGPDSPEELQSTLLGEATVTLAAVRLAHSWLEHLRAARAAAGVLDYGDVLARAIELLEAPDLDMERLRTHFGYRHLLVDELQDTNADQVRLVRTLRRRLTEAGLQPTLFGVGDPKQSIYRFRGAEVEVFEDQLRDGHERLTMCWRSTPALTRSLDRLFEGLLGGAGPDGSALDPQAAVPWEPLAPRTDDNGPPAIDLLRGADDDEEPEDEDGNGEPQAEALAAALELSPYDRQVASHLAHLLDAHPDWTAAVLCHSWGRARHWGEALSTCGVPAYVQGGRGLLETPEVRALLNLLDALEAQDDDLAWLGLLRGPLCGLSDAGLVCLRRGRGLSLRSFDGADDFEPAGPRNRLSRLRLGFEFSAADAVAAIEAERGSSVAPGVREALAADEARLQALATLWDAVRRDWGIAPLSELVARALHLSGLRAVLHHRGVRGGPIEARAARRALVNLRTFEDLVDTVSAETDLLPGDAVRRLRALSEDGDDPADGGVLLTGGRSVAVTTVHQAKGLEWDLVVLPDLGRVRVRSRGGDLAPGRKPGGAARSGGDAEAWTVGSLVENPKDLFRTQQGLGGRLAQHATLAAERAENRRLLYVATTRARERLVLGAPWPTGPAEEVDHAMAKLRNKRSGPAPMGLRRARSWYEDLVVALGLDAPADGSETGPAFTRAWEVGRDVRWVTPGEDVPGLQDADPAAASGLPSEALARAAQPVPHVPWTRLNPSKVRGGAPAADPTRAAPACPALTTPSPVLDPRLVGTLAHHALERWGFDGQPTAALVDAALAEVLGDAGAVDGARAWLLDLLRHMPRSQPALVEQLRAAAAAGRLFHEVAVSIPDPSRQGRWEGLIDLLWQDVDGAWHLLDYKVTDTDAALDEGEEPEPLDLEGRIRTYASQVATYARLLDGRLPGGAGVASFGLWFVRDGVVARWDRS